MSLGVPHRGPYQLETLSSTLRIIDKDGADVVLLGSARDEFPHVVGREIVNFLNARVQHPDSEWIRFSNEHHDSA